MIYIVLPVHNRKEITKKFVKSLISQTYQWYRLILVDDGSIDGTSEMVLSYLPKSVILKGDGSLWWAGGLQKGYEWLIKNAKEEDLCLLINDDTIFDENFLDIGSQIISKKNETLLLAQCYSQSDSALLDSGVNVDLKTLVFTQAKTKEDINCLSTRGLFLKVKDFKTIGGFHQKILPHYLSDYEFTIRAFQNGFKLITDKKLKLYVDEETTGFDVIKYDGVKDYYSRYFSNRNTSNPFHWIVFIYLVVPYPFKVYHILRVFYNMVKNLIEPLIKNNI